MARTVDITEKLTFDGNPSLVIKGVKLEVNADAPTMLKIMNMSGKSGDEMEFVKEAYELIFPEKSRKEIEKMKLNVPDWQAVVEAAMTLVIGDGDSTGEQ